MWKWLVSIFQRRGSGLPAGVAMRDASIDAAVDKVLKVVALQLGAAQSTLDQMRTNQSTILGYVATLADAESQQLIGHDQRAAAALIAILVVGKMSGESADHAQLMNEFSELERTRDYGYGQGGAMALEDCEAVANGNVPRALALWMKSAGRA